MEPAAFSDAAATDKYPSDPPKIRLRAVKTRARAALYAEDHYHKTVIACFMPILLFCFLFILIDAAPFFFDLLSGTLPETVCQVLFIAASLIVGFLFAFLIFAVTAGVYGFASNLKTYNGSTTTIPDTSDLKRILSPICTRQKRKETFSALMRFLLFTIPGALPLILFLFLDERFLFPTDSIPFILITAALSVMLFLYAVIVLWDMAAIPYLSKEEDGVTDFHERMRVSRRIMKKYRSSAIRLLISFVPLLLLSLLTLGLLLLLYVLPYMTVSCAKLAEFAYLEYKENI